MGTRSTHITQGNPVRRREVTHIDIHIIQSVPPSNMNRDDTGSPKTAVYGGVRRARVSSQAWKRATRRDFADYLDTSEVGVRTKRAVELLAARICALDSSISSEIAQARATDLLEVLGLKVKEKRRTKGDTGPIEPPLTEYLIFFSNLQLDRLATLVVESLPDKVSKADAKRALDSDHSYDVALFGRMVANDADLNVDAACQVAHAISTHAVANEFDYFTAVDDKNPADETGAGMIGTVEFNSATLYRYATVNVQGLQSKLGDPKATTRAAQAFVRSFVTSMPSGKQNTFANGTLPDAVVVSVREGRPVSLVGAFEEAVPDQGKGWVEGSCTALTTYAHDVGAAYGPSAGSTWVVRVGSKTASVDVLGTRVSLDELVEQLGSQLEALLPSEA